jgi:hypothetical protein
MSGRRNYVVCVLAQGFAIYPTIPMTVRGDRSTTLTVRLKLATQFDQMTVSDDADTDTNPNNNASALALNGKAIDDVPLDATQLVQEL